jgi:hypothetical protein
MDVISSATAVDSHDIRALRVASLRARFLRVLLVAAAGVLLALAVWSTRGLSSGTAGLLPGSTGVVVIDLSLSIGGDDYASMRRRAAAHRRRFAGLVIFSDADTSCCLGRARLSWAMLRFLAAPSRDRRNPWSGASGDTDLWRSSPLDAPRPRRAGRLHHLLSDLITAPGTFQLVRCPRPATAGIDVRRPLAAADGRTLLKGCSARARCSPSRSAVGNRY